MCACGDVVVMCACGDAVVMLCVVTCEHVMKLVM